MRHSSTQDDSAADSLLDQEISQLYNQRKQAVTTPNINLQSLMVENSVIKRESNASAKQGNMRTSSNKRALPWLVLLGGTASFGILAVMSHLIAPEQHPDDSFDNQLSSTIHIAEQPIEPEAETDIIVPPLPPKPDVITPDSSPNVSHEQWQTPSASATALAEVEMPDTQVTLPQLVEPTLQGKFLPVAKVMPEYPARAQQAKITGVVSLSYQINDNGKVESIELASPRADKLLERSAIKALKQWQFADEAQGNKQQVVFEFSLTND